MVGPTQKSLLRVAAWAALLVPAPGCGGGPTLEVPAPRQQVLPSTDSAGEGGQEDYAECDGAPDGTPCGPVGADRHCIYDVCVENACGDGFEAGVEECDDGNQEGADGCDARCRGEDASDAGA